MEGVYLIHFKRRYRHARHYIGYTSWDPFGRIRYHAAGQGNPLLAAVTRRGTPWRVVLFLKGASRTDERRLKNEAHPERHCPICQGRKGRLRSSRWIGVEDRRAAERQKETA